MVHRLRLLPPTGLVRLPLLRPVRLARERHRRRGLWARRANAPWGWDDHDDGGQLLGGEFATDPAKLISIYFSNLGSFSRSYLRNGYQS